MSKLSTISTDLKGSKPVSTGAGKREAENVLEKNADVIKAYDDFYHGKITRNQLFWIVWEKLKAQVESQVNRQNRRMNGYQKHIDFNRVDMDDEDYDLEHEAYLEVLDHLLEYDPRRVLPGTFFIGRINGAHQKLVRGDKTVHYLTMIRKLNHYAQELGFESIADEKLSEVKLATISGESIQVVRRAKYMSRAYTPVAYEAVEDTVEDPYHSDPESLFIKNDRKEKGIQIFHEKLTVTEQKVYIAIKADQVSYRTLALELAGLSKDVLSEEWGFEKAPSPHDLTHIINVCDRKLGTDRYIAAQRESAKKYDCQVEQAQVPELEHLMEEPQKKGEEDF